MYSILFVSGGLLNFFIQFHLGVRRNLDRGSLAVTLLVSSALFIFFMKVPGLISGHDVSIIASTRYMMTGIVGAIAGLLLCRYLLGIGFQRLDDVALVFPFTLALMKLGCFLTGCCFGTPTEWLMGTTAPAGSPAAFYFHDHPDLRLHPVQLYESFGCLFIWLTAIWSQKRWRQPGSLFFYSLAAYLLVRFTAEFFRTTPAWETVFLGMKFNQIALLIVFIITLLLTIRNERNTLFQKLQPESRVRVKWLVLLTTLFAGILLNQYFHFIEKTVLMVQAVFALFILTYESWPGQYKLVPLVRSFIWVSCFVVATAQVSIDSTKTKDHTKGKSPKPFDSLVYKFHEVKVGFGTGIYPNRYSDSDGCDAKSNEFGQEYAVFGAGFSTLIERKRSWQEIRYAAWVGNEKQTWLGGDIAPDKANHSFTSFGASVYAQADLRWVGIGGGLNVGNLRVADNYFSSQKITKGYFGTPILPSAYFRLGPADILYADYRYASLFPSPFPGYQHQIAIGSGFGSRKDISLRFGTLNREGQFLSLKFPIDKLSIEGLYYWGHPYEGLTDFENHMFNLSVGYRYDKPAGRKVK